MSDAIGIIIVFIITIIVIISLYIYCYEPPLGQHVPDYPIVIFNPNEDI